MRILYLALYTLVIFFAVIYFAPKKNLYYLAENILADKGIYFVGETIEEQAFGLKVSNISVVYQKEHVAKIGTMEITPFVIFNRLLLSNITVEDPVVSFIPNQIDTIAAHYLIVMPKTLAWSVDESIKGEIVWRESQAAVTVEDSEYLKQSRYKTVLSAMRLEEGAYRYEFPIR
jgi:hypothetical protein